MIDPARQVYEANFPIVDQLLDAGSHQERAGQLLRLSDGLVLERGEAIAAACRAACFEAGAVFILLRLVALHRVRDAHGLLPDQTAHEIEAWRKGMSQFAASGDGWVSRLDHLDPIPDAPPPAGEDADGQ